MTDLIKSYEQQFGNLTAEVWLIFMTNIVWLMDDS